MITSGLGAIVQKPQPQSVENTNPQSVTSTNKDNDKDTKFTVGTYNIAGGNEDAKKDIQDTTATLADQVVNENVDVVAMQEVDVGTNDADKYIPIDGMNDHNEYTLTQVSAKEAGLNDDATFTRTENADGTVTVTGQDSEGRTSSVTITETYYNEKGEPAASEEEAVMTIYDADVQTPDGVQEYTVVYGSSTSHDGGKYGNSVLLSPDAKLQYDANGKSLIERHDLGVNDPGKNENRTALEVNFEINGEDATVFSAHLTANPSNKDKQKYGISDQDAQDARDEQYKVLAAIAEKKGDNTIIMGDFNDGSQNHVGSLSGENNDENDPTPFALGPPIDRIYVAGDVNAENREHIEGGGSDHNMITWEVTL